MRHIPSLDGLRAISVILVFTAHAGYDQWVPGGLGVTIFFFLSGFLITTLMRTEFERTGRVHFGHFWLRRALRILPPFYLVLIVAIGAALLFDASGKLRLAAVAAQFLHVSNYWMIGHGNIGQADGTAVYWSLAVEEHFYLFFPWLYVAMQNMKLSRPRQALLLWILCAAVLAWRCYLVFILRSGSDRTYFATDTRVDSILFGCALAVWANPTLDSTALNARRWQIVWIPAALAVMLFCVLYRGEAFRETFRYSLQGVALTLIFIAAIRFSDWRLFWILNTRVLAFIGVLSYSLYLVHFPILFAVHRLFASGSRPTLAALAMALSFGLAWIIYALIERPCARLRKRLSD